MVGTETNDEPGHVVQPIAEPNLGHDEEEKQEYGTSALPESSGYDSVRAARAVLEFEGGRIADTRYISLCNTTTIDWFWVVRYPKLSRFSGRPAVCGVLKKGNNSTACNVPATRRSWRVELIHLGSDARKLGTLASKVNNAVVDTEKARNAQRSLAVVLTSVVIAILCHVLAPIFKRHAWVGTLLESIKTLSIGAGAVKALPLKWLNLAEGDLHNLRYSAYRLEPLLQDICGSDRFKHSRVCQLNFIRIRSSSIVGHDVSGSNH